MSQADIGLVGLAVMGENLILNMESKGFTVACYNRTVAKVDDFINGRAKGKKIIGCRTIGELTANLKKPRKVMLMVKAGKAVDDFIEQLLPHLDNGDIIIDGGNSHFPDTIRRTKYVESKGKLYIGTGVSGGEEARCAGRRLCRAGRRRRGRACGRYSRRFAPRRTRGSPAANGSAKTARGILSKWCTTASNTAICS